MNSRDGRTSTSKWQRHLPADSGQGHDTLLTAYPMGVLRRRPISSESAVSLSRSGVSNVRVVRIVEHWKWSSGNKRDGHKREQDRPNLRTMKVMPAKCWRLLAHSICSRRHGETHHQRRRWLKSQMTTKGPFRSVFPCSFDIEPTL
jgi:hypothetical protein